MSPTVLLLRHAEKPDASRGIVGVDENGQRNDASLSVRGWQRAGALAAWLAPASGPAPFGWPQAIWAAPRTAEHPSQRPVQTMLPLARACGLMVGVEVDEADPLGTARLLAAGRGTSVVCARHGALPALARALVSELDAQTEITSFDWPEDCFDRVWIFERREPQGRWNVREVLQGLLDGDRGRRPNATRTTNP